MNTIHDALESGRQLLAENASVTVFGDPKITLKSKLAVLPHMSFWVLGFADAMALLRQKPGEDVITQMVRQHADEDAEHWRWFVRDLANLTEAGIGPKDYESLLMEQWGTSARAVRECTWLFHSLLRTSDDPVIWLTLIECCEAGFETFMSSIRPVIKDAGHYATLQYFGQEHDHAEAGHAMHEHADPFAQVLWTEEQKQQALDAASRMFAALDSMHQSYAEVVLRTAEEDAAKQ